MRLFLLIALASTGCWRSQQAIGPVAWSDDDEGQAYFLLSFQQSTYDGPFGRGTRDHNLRVHVQAPDGSGRRALSSWFEGTLGTDFYYMRQAGYVLFDWHDGPGSRRWELVDLEGRVTTVHTLFDTSEPANPCVGGEILPSPDGRVLARIERFADPRCRDSTLRVTFVQADTLRETASFELPIDRYPASAFTRGGDLLVWTHGAGSWRVDPVEGFVELATEPDCFWPRTSSSALSNDGTRIRGGTPDDPVVVEERGVESCW